MDKILPSKFFQSNDKGDGLLGVMAEKHALSFFIKNFLESNDQDKLDLAFQVMELKSSQWLLCLIINILDLKSTHYIWDNMIVEGSFLEIERTILLIISNQINFLCDPNYDSTLINDSIVRNITVDLLKKNSKIEVDITLKKKHFDDYIKNVSEKWNKKEPFIFRQLERITHFSKDEIKEIQNEFIKFLEEKSKIDKKNEITGIHKSDFIQIMNAIQENKILQGKAFFKLSQSDFDKIFVIFDYDQSGSLDFRSLYTYIYFYICLIYKYINLTIESFYAVCRY